MADPTVGDVLRVVAEWDGPGGMLAQMVYHYRGKSGVSATAAVVGAAVLAAMQLAWTQIDEEIDNELIATTQELLQWDFTLNRWDGIDSRPYTALDGLVIGEMFPHGSAGLVKIFTVAARRQSRKYIPGILKGSLFNGSITAATVTKMALFGAALDVDVVAGGLTLEYGTFNTAPLSPLFETFSQASGAVQAEAVTAYQRRRKPGTGR